MDCIWFVLSPRVLLYEEVQNLLVIGIKITDVSNYLSSSWLLLPFLPARGIQHPNTRKRQSNWPKWFQCLFHEETAQQMRAKLWQLHAARLKTCQPMSSCSSFSAEHTEKASDLARLVSHGFHSEQQSLLNVGGPAHFIATSLPQPQAESTQLSNHLRTKADTYTDGKAKTEAGVCWNHSSLSELRFAQLSTDLNTWKSTRRTQWSVTKLTHKLTLPLGKKTSMSFSTFQLY